MSEIKEGAEIEVVDPAKASEFGFGSVEPGTRFRVAYVDHDGAIQVADHGQFRGYWLPPDAVRLVGDVTAPERAPLPPNPKAAFGAQKPSLSLVPSVAVLHAAMAMENGAAKYGPYNWREKAVEARTYVDACKRHLDAWLDGQENSDDTSPPVHNLGHAIACLGILLDAQECGNLIDNRPLPGKSAEVQNRMKAAKIAAGSK